MSPAGVVNASFGSAGLSAGAGCAAAGGCAGVCAGGAWAKRAAGNRAMARALVVITKGRRIQSPPQNKRGKDAEFTTGAHSDSDENRHDFVGKQHSLPSEAEPRAVAHEQAALNVRGE